jgi:hypothetical protein
MQRRDDAAPVRWSRSRRKDRRQWTALDTALAASHDRWASKALALLERPLNTLYGFILGVRGHEDDGRADHFLQPYSRLDAGMGPAEIHVHHHHVGWVAPRENEFGNGMSDAERKRGRRSAGVSRGRRA